MELPVNNKQRARVQAFVIVTLLILMILLLHSAANGLDIKYFSIALISFTVILTIKHLRKQNIKGAFLIDEIMVIEHGKEKIKINVENIEDINFEIGGFHDKLFEQSVTYILDLKTSYSFGDKIFLKFQFSIENIEKGPLVINIIRKILEHKNRKVAI